MPLQEAERRITKCRERKNPTLDLSNLELTELPAGVFALPHLANLA